MNAFADVSVVNSTRSSALPPEVKLSRGVVTPRPSVHSQHDPTEAQTLPQHETKTVAWLKVVVLRTIVAIGSVMAWLTFHLAREQERSAMNAAFEEQSTRLIDAFHQNIIDQLWVASTIDLSISNAGVLGTFPEVTVPSFDPIAYGQVQLSRGTAVAWAPMIGNEREKLSWETFAVSQITAAGYQHAYNKTYDIGDLEWKGRDIENGIFEFYNENWPARRQGPGPYSPIWQIGPITRTRRAVMLDQFSEPVRARALHRMLAVDRAVFTGILDPNFESKITHEYEGPRSILIYPFMTLWQTRLWDRFKLRPSGIDFSIKSQRTLSQLCSRTVLEK